jgi:tripartite-type tricarboxylate transporter receptor subunit TctC
MVMTSCRLIATPLLFVRAAIVVMGLAQAASAQTFPSKALRIVIPFAPGGSADLQARSLGQRLAETWGQPVIVQPKTGAGTTIGAAYAASQPADGYTLYLAGASHLISGNLYKNLGYHAVKSFAPVSMLANSPYYLVVNPSINANSVKELIELAKWKPKSVTYASAGVGSGSHLAGEQLRMLTGVDIVHVPYQGQQPALVAIAGGEVNMLFADVVAVTLMQAGKLRGLAVTSDKRSTAFPNIPTIGEAGLPTYQMTNWSAILAPAGTPKDIVTRINGAIARELKNPEVVQRFAASGFDTMSSSPEALGKVLASEYAKYAKIIAESGMKIQ